MQFDIVYTEEDLRRTIRFLTWLVVAKSRLQGHLGGFTINKSAKSVRFDKCKMQFSGIITIQFLQVIII